MFAELFTAADAVRFAAEFSVAWEQQFPFDKLDLQRVEVSQGMILGARLEINPEADLLLVIQDQLTDAPGIQDLANLVAARARRRGIQPVVVLATDTPLSKRQVQELGFAGTYFRADQPRRGAAEWGRILSQTWHMD